MAVNVKGVFLAAKYAEPVIKKQKSGVLLITGSTSAFKPAAGRPVLLGLQGRGAHDGREPRARVRPFGARVVAIAPVATETPMLATFMGKKEVDEEGMTRYRGTVPLGRLNQPEDLAKAALFLASDDAAMITGSVFTGRRRPLHLSLGVGSTLDDHHPAGRGVARRPLDGHVCRVRADAGAHRSRRDARAQPLQPGARRGGVGGAAARQRSHLGATRRGPR